jgi:hypothetical protein
MHLCQLGSNPTIHQCVPEASWQGVVTYSTVCGYRFTVGRQATEDHVWKWEMDDASPSYPPPITCPQCLRHQAVPT